MNKKVCKKIFFFLNFENEEYEKKIGNLPVVVIPNFDGKGYLWPKLTFFNYVQQNHMNISYLVK